MDPWSVILGLLVGATVAAATLIPVMRMRVRRQVRQTRDAERRARQVERLAELGSMTSGLAHEIKNPLSTVGLNAQLLTEGIRDADLDETVRERLLRRIEALSRETDRLRGILEDFLQFAGRLQLDQQRVDLVRVIEELADFYHAQCDRQRITLRTKLPSSPLFVSIDVGHFKQSLLNLMINATEAMAAHNAKSTDDPHATIGELMVRVEHAPDDDAEHPVAIHVIDTGPGIEPEKLESIFHPYVSGKRTGTGLGLPTARRIVEEHGGRIEAYSEVGRGSDFVIRLADA